MKTPFRPNPSPGIAIVLLTLSLTIAAAVQPQEEKVEVNRRVKDLIGKYCLGCHSAEKQKGDLNLEDMSYVLDDSNSAQHWQDVLDVLNLGEMPPTGKPAPSKDELTQMLEDLTHTLVAARKHMADTGGRLISRRLNQREYIRFVGQLLGVDVNANLLPDDDTFEGFDTVGASHSLTGFHIDRYLNAAKDALDKLQPNVEAKPVERTDVKHRGGSKKINAAFDEYKKLYESGKRAHPQMNAEIYRRTTPTKRRTYKQHYLAAKNLYENFERFDEGWVIIDPKAGHSVMVNMEGKPAGRYILRTRIAAAGKNQEKGRYVGLQRRSVSDNPLNGSMSYFHVGGTMAEPQVLEIPIETRGYKTDFVMRCRQTEKPQQAEFEDYIRPYQKNRKITWYEEGIWVDWVELIGPLSPNQNQFEEVFFRGVDPVQDVAEQYAEDILERFGARAFRGKAPDASDIGNAIKFYRLAKANSRSFEAVAPGNRVAVP